MMEARLMYFSPTHTTRKVLYEVIKGFGAVEINETNLTFDNPLENTGDIRKIKEEIVFIGCPVYGGHLYKPFREFVKQLSLENKRVVIVLLYGNAGVFHAKNELIYLISSKNAYVLGSGTFVGEHSFSVNGVEVASGRPNEKDLKVAFEFGIKIKETIVEGNEKKMRFCKYHQSIIDKIVDKMHVHTGKKFFTFPSTNQYTCTKCNKCIDVCPKKCIDLNYITNENKCIVCMACVKYCPTQSRKTKMKSPLIKIGLKLINSKKCKSTYEIYNKNK